MPLCQPQCPRHRVLVRFGASCSAILLLASSAAAQRAVLVGTVSAEGGVPLAAAQIGVSRAGVGAGGTVSDDEGRFVLSVPAGEYRLDVARIGFAPAFRTVRAAAGDTVRVNFVLAGRSAQIAGVTVTGQRRRTVSATRTEQALLDIPQAIQVLGQDVLRQQAVIDMKDAVRNVANINFTGTYNGGYQYFSSRGFFMSNVSNFRRNGQMLPNFGQNYADNIESIEILKGPAGILYGDVTPGGIINVTTKQPLSSRQGRLELRTGNYGLVRPSLDITGPIDRDGKVRGRFVSSYEQAGSFRDRVESNALLIAPSLQWEPRDGTKWTVEASVRNDERVGDPGVISPDGTVAGLFTLPRSRFLGEPDATYGYTDRFASSTLEQRLPGGWSLRHVAGATDQSRTPRNLYLGAVNDGVVSRTQYFFHQDRRQYMSSIDLLGKARTGALTHQLLVGADWMDHTSRTGRFAEGRLAGGINLFEPTYEQVDYLPVPTEMDQSALLTRRFGAYVQDQVSFADERVHVLLGARFNHFRMGDRYDNPAVRPADAADVVERPISPRVGVVLKPRPWLATYASFAESYEVNGFDWIDPTVAVPPTFGRQLEVGVKGELFGNRLGATLSAFRIGKSDVYGWGNYSAANPAPTPEDADRGWFTYAGAEHRSEGVELDLNGRLTERLSIVASAALTDATVVRDPVYATGNVLSNTPRESASVWAHYRVGGALSGLDLGTGLFYKGAFYGTDDNDADGRVPANHTIDVSTGYRWRGYHAQINVSNLTDRTSFLGGFGLWEPQWPRRIVVSLSTLF